MLFSLTLSVNANSLCVRTSDDIRKKWCDFRSQVKKKELLYRRKLKQTGGGPMPVPLTELEMKVLNLIPDCQLDGVGGELVETPIGGAKVQQTVTGHAQTAETSKTDVNGHAQTAETSKTDESPTYCMFEGNAASKQIQEVLSWQTSPVRMACTSSDSSQAMNSSKVTSKEKGHSSKKVSKVTSREKGHSSRKGGSDKATAQLIRIEERKAVALEDLLTITKQRMDIEYDRLQIERERLEVEREKLALKTCKNIESIIIMENQ